LRNNYHKQRESLNSKQKLKPNRNVMLLLKNELLIIYLLTINDIVYLLNYLFFI